MEVKDNTQRLYEDIKKEFLKLSDIKEYGVKKFTDDWILAKIGKQFYKAPKTVENIVFNRLKRY